MGTSGLRVPSGLVPVTLPRPLVRIEDMVGWHFYDDAEWTNNAYEHCGVRQQWDHERGERAEEQAD